MRELVVEVFSRFQSDVGDAFTDDPDMQVMLERLGNVLFSGQIQYASLFAQITKLNIASDPLLQKILQDISQGSDIIVEQISHLQKQGRLQNNGNPDEIVMTIIALELVSGFYRVSGDGMRTGSGKCGKLWLNLSYLIHRVANKNILENISTRYHHTNPFKFF
jgi:hypothetical protein